MPNKTDHENKAPKLTVFSEVRARVHARKIKPILDRIFHLNECKEEVMAKTIKTPAGYPLDADVSDLTSAWRQLVLKAAGISQAEYREYLDTRIGPLPEGMIRIPLRF